MTKQEAYVAGWWDGWEAFRDYLFLRSDKCEPDPTVIEEET